MTSISGSCPTAIWIVVHIKCVTACNRPHRTYESRHLRCCRVGAVDWGHVVETARRKRVEHRQSAARCWVRRRRRVALLDRPQRFGIARRLDDFGCSRRSPSRRPRRTRRPSEFTGLLADRLASTVEDTRLNLESSLSRAFWWRPPRSARRNSGIRIVGDQSALVGVFDVPGTRLSVHHYGKGISTIQSNGSGRRPY